MKKLKLKALELGAKDVLTREQLKKVMGGTGGSGTCCAHTRDWSESWCDISKADAIAAASPGGSFEGGNWCCASC